MAQRPASPAPVNPAQDPQLKLPAPPAPYQAPLTRETNTSIRPSLAPAKSPELDTQHAGYRIPHDQLYVSQQPDGSPQVRARAFKAEFTPQSATYIPFCGSAAPLNHPLSFQIQGITSGAEPVAFDANVVASIAGQTVSYARGGVTEVYELDLDTIEQEFVFDSLPSSGDLVVRLAVSTDMQASVDGDSIVFSSADGSVRYSAATVVDANGVSAPASTELDGNSIALRVSAEFLATASFPVTIDPVFSTFGITWNAEPVDSFAPAIAWDESNQRYCVAYQEVFSATDNDVVRTFVSPTGGFQSGAYVDTSLSAYWAKPDVANNNDSNTFLIAAEVGLPTSGTRTIHGRIVDAATAALGADVLISTADSSGEKVDVSVGGDPAIGFNTYTVVWRRIFVAGADDDVHARRVTATGALVGTSTILVDNSGGTLDRLPRIAKSCEGPGTFHVVWERQISATDHDVYGAEMLYDGTVSIASTLITSGGNTITPACSPIDNTGNWLLVYSYDFGDHDIMGSLMSGVTVLHNQNLSYLESALGTGNLFQDQIHPAADTDGVHFAYSYSEAFSTSTTDYDIYVATVDTVNSQLQMGEFQQNLAFSTTHEDFPRMCSRQGAGGSGRELGLAWSDTGGTNLGNIEGGTYGTSDFAKICSPGFNGVSACPCSQISQLGKGCDNSSFTGGASLEGFGGASISVDTAYFVTSGEKPTATSIVSQGNALLANGVSFGQGVRCAGGTLKRLYTKTAVAGSITAPTGGDPSIHNRSATLGDPLAAGSTRYYYVYYRDPSVLGSCASNLTFNSTDTVQVIWRP
ncbi:MAG: hypothetical protein IPJ19_02680 [Planctomycetes bacterium]|nr:hypothetical protein [Planctomycetota bacterium]